MAGLVTTFLVKNNVIFLTLDIDFFEQELLQSAMISRVSIFPEQIEKILPHVKMVTRKCGYVRHIRSEIDQ